MFLTERAPTFGGTVHSLLRFSKTVRLTETMKKLEADKI